MAQPAQIAAIANPLLQAYAAAWQRIIDQEVQLAVDPLNAAKRARLEQLRAEIEKAMDDLDAQTAAWIKSDLPKIYEAGAAVAGAFKMTALHSSAIDALANDTFTDLLAGTNKVRASTKTLVQQIGKNASLQRAIDGKTAAQAALEMRNTLLASNVHAVIYANGAKQGIAGYSNMVLRTKTAVAFNTGTINEARQNGTQFLEVFDGFQCGWTDHDDPELANGMIVDADDAADNPISHPNCTRAFGPRPDITTDQELVDAQAISSAAAEAAAAAGDIGDSVVEDVAPELVVPDTHQTVLNSRAATLGSRQASTDAFFARPLETRLPFQEIRPLTADELKALSNQFVADSRVELEARGIDLDEVHSLVTQKISVAADEDIVTSAEVTTTAARAGGRMKGLDFRIKGEGSMERKLVTDIAEKETKTAQQVADEIGDSLRYTIIADPADIVGVEIRTLDDLEAQGWDVAKAKNVWLEQGPYKGLNTTVRNPRGLLVEVQFHTPDSFAMKEHVNHKLYEEWRLPVTDDARKEALNQQMIRNNAVLQVPANIENAPIK